MQKDSWNVCTYTRGDVEQEIWLSVSYIYDLNYYKYRHNSVRHYFRFT